MMMKLFRRMGKAKKKWRRKAWLADPNKTRIIFESTTRPKHVPPWIFKEPDQSVRELLASSRIRKEYGLPK
jgi:hypothetical protein